MTEPSRQEALQRLEALERQLRQFHLELDAVRAQIKDAGAGALASELKTETPEVAPVSEPAPPTAKPAPPVELPLLNVLASASTPASAASLEAKPGPAHSNFEVLLGRHVFDKVALAALLLAGCFFLKVAFERGWISDAVKIIMGTLAGVGLLFWSEFLFNRQMKRYASVIAASGFGLLFLTVYGGLYLYRLFPPRLAFVYLLVATAALVLQAVRHESQALAVWSLCGAGFAPQIMAGFYPDSGILIRGEVFPATRQPFTLQVPYLVAINIGYSWLVFRRQWPLVRLGLLLVNIITILGWEVDLANRWWMATLLWILAAMFVAPPYNSRARYSEAAEDPAPVSGGPPAMVWKNLHLITTAIAVSFFFLRLHYVNEQVKTVDSEWVTLSFAVLTACGVAAHRFFGNFRHVSLLSTLTALFLYFFCAQAWRGWKLTIAWLLLCAAFNAVNARSASAAAKFKPLGAWIVFASALVYAVLHPAVTGAGIGLARALFLNEKAAMLALTATAGLLLYFRLNSRGERFGKIYLISTVLLGWYWVSHLVEQYVHFRTDWFFSFGATAQVRMSVSVAWSIYAAVLLTLGVLNRNAVVRKMAMGILLATILKVFLYDVSNLETLYRFISFLVLSVVLYAVSYAYNRFGKRLGL
ncbi:MAG TPA: DUF2339 domain-containing protein [Acidobacteriota bacterium]|jgi:uncharacterized membrane protein